MRYSYVILTEQGNVHLCVTLQETVGIMDVLDKQESKYSIYKKVD